MYWTLYEIESALRRWEKYPEIKSLNLKLHPQRLQEFKNAGIELKAMADRYQIHLIISPDVELPLDTHELTGLVGEKP